MLWLIFGRFIKIFTVIFEIIFNQYLNAAGDWDRNNTSSNTKYVQANCHRSKHCKWAQLNSL